MNRRPIVSFGRRSWLVLAGVSLGLIGWGVIAGSREMLIAGVGAVAMGLFAFPAADWLLGKEDDSGDEDQR